MMRLPLLSRMLWLTLVTGSMLGVRAGHAESLYVESTYRALAGDNRAYRVGDLLTVQVYENSSASTSTDTTTQQTNRLSAGVSSLLSSRQLGGAINQAGSFDGGGTTQRANKLLTTLSVTVREVLPNGDLKVSGEQLLVVNEEQHKVDLEGRIRPQDISTDNVVLSTRLADAHINYIGDGDLSDRQRRVWWRKIADWLGF